MKKAMNTPSGYGDSCLTVECAKCLVIPWAYGVGMGAHIFRVCRPYREEVPHQQSPHTFAFGKANAPSDGWVIIVSHPQLMGLASRIT